MPMSDLCECGHPRSEHLTVLGCAACRTRLLDRQNNDPEGPYPDVCIDFRLVAEAIPATDTSDTVVDAVKQVLHRYEVYATRSVVSESGDVIGYREVPTDELVCAIAEAVKPSLLEVRWLCPRHGVPCQPPNEGGYTTCSTLHGTHQYSHQVVPVRVEAVRQPWA